jgi:glucan 1,3-beta-glucosidase
MRGLHFLVALAAVALPAAGLAQQSGPAEPGPKSAYWYETITHNGISPTIPDGQKWTVFRNVRDYGARGDGTTDDTAAIQRAIATGDGSRNRLSAAFGSTGQPAVVYFPPGTYLVSSTLSSAVSTVLAGDPTDRAVIKASPAFAGTYLVFGRDRTYSGLVGFYHGIKNLVLDTTAVPAAKKITLLEWGVSQANQLSNVRFKMPLGASGHSGIAMPTTVSPLIMNDLEFFGGDVGINLYATQYHLKNILFKSKYQEPAFRNRHSNPLYARVADATRPDVKTAVKVTSLVQGTGQGLRFEDCVAGIDTSGGGSGTFNLIDSTATNTSVVVNAGATSTPQGSLVLENVIVDASVSSVSCAVLLCPARRAVFGRLASLKSR